MRLIEYKRREIELTGCLPVKRFYGPGRPDGGCSSLSEIEKAVAVYSRMLYLMHVISKKAIETFWCKHPAARSPLESWYRIVSKSSFETLSELRRAFNSADYVNPYTVFDVGGNNFRVIAVIHYNRQKLYIREVLTHAEYDRWSKAKRSKKI
jgi:mRNA interferase HigB